MPCTTSVKGQKGYTLIELTVVIVLIGLMFAFVVPRFRLDLLTDDLKGTVRGMIGRIKTLRNEAVHNQKTYVLHFDLESNLVWVDSTDMGEEARALAREKAFHLPNGIRVLDVWLKGRGKKMTGETAIVFNSKGYVQPSAIHLASDDDRIFTLALSPFTGKIKVYDEYVEFDDT
ncbi:MAG: prepilin-type N-terminal cleavage/methylation domain-containing protein [Desulfatiglans sp.]|nr:prepilin-type N-terminal cleavage/methylation domain-containing protein [Desulfatiglans sp.]